MVKTARERITELRIKKDNLKSKRLGKKETEELRQLVDENAQLFMIFCWCPEDIEYVENALKEKEIRAETFKMPDSFNLKFF